MIDLAYAMAGAQSGGSQGSAMWTFIPLVLVFVVFYVMLIRPQQKKAKEHRQLLDNLKRGDQVVTSGGLYGVITGLTDQTVTLEISDKIRVRVGRGYISGFAPKEGRKAANQK